MSGSKFDVIVIGSGPAGATAAYRLARAGLKTLLLEKEKLPRYKACGGAITNKVLQRLDFDIAPLIEDTVTHVALSYRHRALVSLDFALQPVSLVMRDRFDNYLTQRAVEQGAVVHDEEAVEHLFFEAQGVRVNSPRGEYTAEVVVGADGANGLTARAAHLAQPRSVAAALEEEVAVSDAQLDAWRHRVCLDLGAIPYGYAWIFPKADHLSVGIGTYVRGPLFRHFALRGGEARANLRARLNDWMAGEVSLLDHRVLIQRGHLVPLGGRAVRLHNPRVVLAGDAGGLVEPLLSEGIYYALRSGQIAAEVITDAFRREHLDLSRHTTCVQSEFLPTFENAAGIARLAYRFPYASLMAVSIAPPLRNSLGRVMEGSGDLSNWLRRIVQGTGDWLDRL